PARKPQCAFQRAEVFMERSSPSQFLSQSPVSKSQSPNLTVNSVKRSRPSNGSKRKKKHAVRRKRLRKLPDANTKKHSAKLNDGQSGSVKLKRNVVARWLKKLPVRK